jgi:RNA polymerase sigma factor (sigma-70 family)
MKEAFLLPSPVFENSDNSLIVADAFRKEKQRLLQFIRRRIPKTEDAEDILQDVFEQLTESFDVLRPIEQLTAWLFRVTRNKIIDRYRKKKPESLENLVGTEGEEKPDFLALLTDAATPEDDLMRSLVWETLQEALLQLPDNQREVFVWHELEDRSFKEISEMTGVAVNTLLSRKRYAVLFLRERLRQVYEEFMSR